MEKGFVEFNRDLYAVNPLQIILQGWVDYIWTDEITVSAPFGRVDLEALKRPRLGGKEPSDDDYRV